MFSRLIKIFSPGDPKQVSGLAAPPPGLRQVTSDASRCVQCGICVYNCPVGIDVREYTRRGENVTDSRCISCGTCVEMCPRGTVKWGPAILVRSDDSLEIAPNDLPNLLQLQSRKLP